MKPPRFEYSAPATLAEALSAIVEGEGEARPLAGGQSLIPLLNFRLAAPATLVDLGRLPELVGIAVDDSKVAVGAMTPTARLQEARVAAAAPLIAAAARLVGHPQIRHRGTVGGSIAHADPAAELPAVAVLIDAEIEIQGPRGRRVVAAEDFFAGLFTTACDWDELVTAVRFPLLADGTGWGFREFARRPGDFAIAGVGLTASLRDGVVDGIRAVAFGVGGVPIRARGAEEALRGRPPTSEVVGEAAAALTREIEPADTLHGSGEYRRHVAGVLFERALEDALGAMGEGREVSA
jgi:carbon-monoxide dehydrogenase medium subunit